MSQDQPGRRPGTVTGAAVLVIVMNALLAVVAAIGIAFGLWLAISPETASNAQDMAGIMPMTATAGGIVAMIAILTLAFGVLMILFSLAAMRGRNWARVVSTVLLALGILSNIGSLFGPTDGGGRLLGLVLPIIALVLYWLPPSNRWYAAVTGRTSATPGTPPQPGAAPG